MPTIEGVARGGGSTTSGELSLAPPLGARAGRTAIRPRPESTSFPASRAGEGGGAAASAVRSRLGPNRDAQNTIEARRRAESVDNQRNNHSRQHDDRGRERRHDSDDDRDRS
jgi:hypothetical protein